MGGYYFTCGRVQFANAFAFIPGLFLLLVPIANRFVDIGDTIKFVLDEDP